MSQSIATSPTHYLSFHSFLSFRVLVCRYFAANLIALFCYYFLLNLSGLLGDARLHLLQDLTFNYLICHHLIIHFHLVALAHRRRFTLNLIGLGPLIGSSDVDRHLNFCHCLDQNFANFYLHAIEEQMAKA